MPSRFEIVESIEHELEAAEPSDVELSVLDIRVVGNNLDVRVKSLGSLLRNLNMLPVRNCACTRGMCSLSYQRFRLLDMLVSEEELAVEVAEVNGIKVDDVNFAEAG